MGHATVQWERPDDVEREVRAVLQLLADCATGAVSWPDRPETEHVDLKEEAGRAVFRAGLTEACHMDGRRRRRCGGRRTRPPHRS